MKAYYLSIADDSEGVQAVVFANNAREAKKRVYRTYLVDYWSGEWIYLRVNRAKRFDGMEDLTESQLARVQWRDGWQWTDAYDMPDPDEATDEQFDTWYEGTFGFSHEQRVPTEDPA